MNHSAALTAIALLMVVACGGDGGSGTTSSSTTSTSVPGESTSTQAGTAIQPPTTVDGIGTTEATTADTLPPVIAQVGFAFATGADPRLQVRVSVAESSGGPWIPAGVFDPPPILSGPSYWVRFDVTNVDQLNAVMTDLVISGFEAGSPFGEDVCELDAPLPKDGVVTCVIGGFPVQPGSNDIDFDASGEGPRQGEPDRWFDPPIPTSLEFDGHRNSFALVFDTEEGVRIEGTADGAEVDLNTAGIAGSVRLDCAGGNPFTGTPALKAYVIENFSAAGELTGGCSEIPTAILGFLPDGDSDDAYFYEGVAAGTTTTTSTTIGG